MPSNVLAGQLRRWAEVREELIGDGFDAVHPPAPVAVIHPELVDAPAAAIRQLGGSGERKTLRLVARYADACNLFGDAATVRHKVDVLRGHCAEVGRDPADVEVTHLSLALDASVDEQVGRYRTLAEAGVQTAMVRFPTLDEAAVEAFAPVIAAFS